MSFVSTRTDPLGRNGAASPAGIPRRPAGEPIPLSFAQRSLWFLHQLDPTSPVYHRPLVLRLIGNLDPDALERALNEIVIRHEVLRTSFPVEKGMPWQVIAPELHVPLRVVDLRHLPPDERRDRANIIARDEACGSFDLSDGPLFRAMLLRTAEEEHLLVTSMHHAVFDGWSSQIFLNELSVFYTALTTDETPDLRDLPIQYADFAVWQRDASADREIVKQLDFWRQQLEGLPRLDLSNGFRPPSSQMRPSGRQHVRLPRSLSDALRKLAREERATPFMVLLATFKLLLQRYSGQDDLSVGCPVAGRRRTEVEELIGCFVNTLVLRSNLSGDPSFRELLARVRHTTLGALSNQDVPFEMVVEELRPARSLVHAPFFQVFFQLRNYPRHSREIEGLLIEEDSLDLGFAGLDLKLELTEDESGLSGWLIYDTDIFRPEAAAHMAEQYADLLRQVVEEPGRPASEYSLVTLSAGSLLPDPSEVIHEPRYETVVNRFRDWVARTPQHTALRQGERAWSYTELASSVDALVRRLVAEGLQPGDAVGILGPRSFGVTASMLAVVTAGGVLLPLSPELPAERRRFMLCDADAKILLSAATHEDEFDGLRVIRLNADTAEVYGSGPPVGHGTLHSFLNDSRKGSPNDRPEAVVVSSEDPAYIFYTSGTTGRPKGVLGVHKGLSHFLSWQRETFGIGPEDRCAHLTSISFDGVLRDIFLPLTSGATVCIPPPNLEHGGVPAWLAAEGVTVVHTVPSLARLWLTEGAAVDSLRFVFFSGEPLTDTLVKAWRKIIGRHADVVNLYGPTETTMVKCFYRVPDDPSPGNQPVGTAQPYAQALVLGPGDRRCGINERGEIVLRTPFATRGYVNRPDEMARRFLVNPFRDDAADILYRTGDSGYYRADGLLVVSGRVDHQIKIRGFRIEPEEISAVLARRDDVESAVVVARSDSDGEKILVAYVVPGNGTLTGRTLRADLASHLPAAMIPSAFIFLAALPVTPNGKVDRSRLPDPHPSAFTREYAAPRNHHEEEIARIWAEVLGRERIGIDDDLFDLGGHSLLILRIASRMRERLGVETAVQQFFETPTIRQLAPAIDLARSTAPADDVMTALLEELDDLTDEQIRALLSN